jgi:hypothetical protein
MGVSGQDIEGEFGRGEYEKVSCSDGSLGDP